MGIAPEHRPGVFDRFYRVEESRTLRGAGLGLAITKEIAHLHGARMDVSSTIGRGSTFSIYFPIHMRA